jgi:hypothetical protein
MSALQIDSRFLFYGANYQTISARHVKFDMEIDHNHTYALRINCRL